MGMHFDFWYKNTKKDVAFVSVFFSDLDSVYRGNVYDSNKKCIGDFWANDSVSLEKAFPEIFVK